MIRLIKEETGLSYSYIGEAVIALGYREYISGNTHFLRPEVKDTDLAN